jgi:hypothetical protein
MYKWQPMVLPLTGGKTDNKSDVDARVPGISDAENIQFSKTGSAIEGRPGYVRKTGFGLRNYSVANTPTADTNAMTLVATGYNPRALFNYRDSGADRPGLLADGRIWTYDGDRWTDRLYCLSARVDRLANLETIAETAAANHTTGYNFATGYPAPLLTADGAVDTWASSTSLIGGAARVTLNSVDYHCVVGYAGAAGTMKLYVRHDDEHSLHTYTITLPKNQITPARLGDAPCACADYDAGALYIAYITVDDTIMLLQVDPTDGSLDAHVELATEDAPNGLWVTNTSVATNRIGVVCTYGGLGVNDVSTYLVNMATLVEVGTRVDTGMGHNGAGPVVCGAATGGVFWFAVRTAELASPSKNYGLRLGTRALTGTGVNLIKHFTPYDLPSVNWGIMHQPVTFQGRTLLGTWAESGITINDNTNGTWTVIDLTDADTTADGNKITLNAGLAAQGVSHGTANPFCPSPAVVSSDGLQYRFASADYQEFNADGGLKPALGINKITLIEPQTDAFGEQTVIGGSVPHLLARGYCAEVGFPWLGAPEIMADADNEEIDPPVDPQDGVTEYIAVPAGSYTVQAVWVWTDEAGQVHRSAPSLDHTWTANGSSIYGMRVLNCQLTQREYGAIRIEVYCTDTNPTNIAAKYLVANVSQQSGAATFVLLTGDQATVPADREGHQVPQTTALPLYTTGGVYQNLWVSADGGLASLGRRLWLSDGVSAYASKLTNPGQAPAWNDEGGLVVTPPSTAGRIVSLSAMDDKLLIFCERGCYMTQGEGPDNLGEGQDFLNPFLVSRLGVTGPRACQLTDKGVVFQVASTGNTAFSGEEFDGTSGGLWIVDRGLSLGQVSGPIENDLPSDAMDLAFSQERQVLYCMTQDGTLLAWDMRANAWARWTTPVQESSPVAIVVSDGVLWQVAAEPGAYNGERGYDKTATGDANRRAYAMMVKTNHLFANGSDGLGWSRVRSLRALGEPATHTLTVSALYDQSTNPAATQEETFAVDSAAFTSSWPHSRYAPEWRLPVQKCSSLQVTLSAFPATGAWTALELMVQPQNRAPAYQRS